MGYPSSLQHHSIGGSVDGAYVRYGDGDKERGPGRGSYPSKEYSDYRDKEHQNTTTLENQEDTTIATDSKKSENWKDQVSDMMKHLRQSIMVDVKELMNENKK